MCLLWVYVVIEHMVNSKWFQMSTSWTRKFSERTLAPICWDILDLMKLRYSHKYRQISNKRRTKSQNLNVSHLVLQLSLPNLLKPCIWEWKCSWSSADRRCSNYIWVINNLIAHKGAVYIRDLTVCYGLTLLMQQPGYSKAWSMPNVDALDPSLHRQHSSSHCIAHLGWTGKESDSFLCSLRFFKIIAA